MTDSNTSSDQAMVNAIGIETPSPTDCVFGRGRSFQNHPGNLFLHKLVDERLGEYRRAKPGPEKNLIIESIVRGVKEGDKETNRHPGRFLRRGATLGKKHILWEEVDDVDARAKVGHTIRSRMRAVDIANGVLQPSGRRVNIDGRSASAGLIKTRISDLAAHAQTRHTGKKTEATVGESSGTNESNGQGLNNSHVNLQNQVPNSITEHVNNQDPSLLHPVAVGNFSVPTNNHVLGFQRDLKMLSEAGLLSNPPMLPQFPQLVPNSIPNAAFATGLLPLAPTPLSYLGNGIETHFHRQAQLSRENELLSRYLAGGDYFNVNANTTNNNNSNIIALIDMQIQNALNQIHRTG